MRNIIIEMDKLQCTLCNNANWLLVRDDQDLIEFNCIKCKSTFMEIYNEDQIQRNIDYIRSNQI